MRQSVAQELDFGCGVACFAFICQITFKQALLTLDRQYSVKHGWRPSDLVAELNRQGLNYKNFYVRKKPRSSYPNATIVLLERSKNYPVGHYLVLENGKWMDPWINIIGNNNLQFAKSGFRQCLPGKPPYALIPTNEM